MAEVVVVVVAVVDAVAVAVGVVIKSELLLVIIDNGQTSQNDPFTW